MGNTLNKVIELTDFQNQTIDFESLTQAGYDTVLLECGGGNTSLSQDTPLKYFETHYNQAITANFKIGYFFWVYSNVDPKIQAQEYFNLVKDKKVDCKLMLDVETGSVKNTETGVYYGYYNNMSIEEITIGIIEELKILMSESGLSNINDKDFIVYSSRGFFEENLANILDKYLLWVADPTGVSPNIDTNIVYNGRIFNWTGYQWNQDVPFTGVGASCDLDVFKSEAFFSTPIILGESTGPLPSEGSNNLKIGTDVKITSGTNFAPNLIPSSDKGVKYTIESINGSMCKLSEINEWVNFEDLSLIQSPNPPSEPIGSLAHPKGSNANAEEIFNICKEAGWSVEAICGMLGNLSWESYLNPTQGQQGGGGGYGLAQWSYSDLVQYAEDAGVSDYNSIPGQIQIIIYQMNNGGGGQYLPRTNTPSGNPIPSGFWLSSESFISSHNNPSSLAQTWMYYYEAPMILDAEKREEGAEYWYAYFNQK